MDLITFQAALNAVKKSFLRTPTGGTDGQSLTKAGTVGAWAHPASFGFPMTIDVGAIRSTDNVGVGTANQAIYMRVREGGTISKVGLSVAASSGNISVAAYRNSGAGAAAVPGTQLATSGAVACPTTGYQEIALGSTVTLYPGDWLAISADNVTFTVRSALAGATDSNQGKGRQYRQATAHPLPATPASLVATIGYTLALTGV